jgi:hypothetical protein
MLERRRASENNRLQRTAHAVWKTSMLSGLRRIYAERSRELSMQFREKTTRRGCKVLVNRLSATSKRNPAALSILALKVLTAMQTAKQTLRPIYLQIMIRSYFKTLRKTIMKQAI